MDPTGATFYGASADGAIYRFKVRGLSLRDPLGGGADGLFSLAGLNLKTPDGDHELLAAAGRAQRLKFWCASNNLDTLSAPVDGVTAISQTKPGSLLDDDSASIPTGAIGQIDLEEGVADTIPEVAAETDDTTPGMVPGSTDAKKAGFVAQSELLKVPFGLVRSGQGQPLLWAAQKTGNLTIFNPLLLAESPAWRVQVLRCKGLAQ